MLGNYFIFILTDAKINTNMQRVELEMTLGIISRRGDMQFDRHFVNGGKLHRYLYKRRK